MKRIRLILADDHPDLLATIKNHLEKEFEIVATVSGGHALVEAANRLSADVVVTDISMPDLTGLEAARILKEAGSTAKIVFLTVHNDPDIVRACLNSGAFGYVLKSRLAADLILAIRCAMAGNVFVSTACVR